MEKAVEVIAEKLFNELNYVYCDTCRHCYEGEEDDDTEVGFKECEFCHRKDMYWKISRQESERLAKVIVDLVSTMPISHLTKSEDW